MTELNDIFPLDLKETFHSLDYEEGGLIVRAVKYFDNELHFDFLLYLGDIEHNETQLWQLQVKNCRDSRIDIENLGSYFSFYSDHFLLWEFIDKQTQLYYKKGTNNPEKLLADIYAVHNTVFDRYIPIEKFLNLLYDNNLLTLCKSNYGLFAKGPERILKYYYECLDKVGKEPYFYSDFVPEKSTTEQLIAQNKDLKVAILGGTYFVGQTFNFKRLDK